MIPILPNKFLKNKKPSKYKNKKTVIDGIEFDSRAEARRWQELKLLGKAGKITRLIRQPEFVLAEGVKYAGAKRKKPDLKYRGDFEYFENGVRIVEDVKGALTKEFSIKRHLMLALLGIDVRIVR